MSSLLSLSLLAGCEDDFMEPDANSAGNSDIVAFKTGVGAPTVLTRGQNGDKPLYEPLELKANGSDAVLYLHTYDAEMIGYDPTRDAGDDLPQTRGRQIESVAALEEFHSNFMVHALLKGETTPYIDWVKAKPSIKGSDIWLTDKTRYWPSQNILAFHAVSPATEFESLRNLSAVDDDVMTFNYTACKGTNNNDAEAQKDLMIAASTCNKEGSVNGRAPLMFHHALSAIKFAVRDVMDGEVVNIKISGVYGSGQCQYEAGDDSRNGVFTWDALNTRETYSQDFNYKLTDRGVVDTSSDQNDIVLNDRMPEKTFMLIPQALSDDARIEVTIRRTGITSQAIAAGVKEEITVGARIKDNGVDRWLPGHEYIYTISTSKDNWVYVLEAYGNHTGDLPGGAHSADGSLDGDHIYVYSPSEERPGELYSYYHNDYGNNAYFKVKSYRYRANNMSQTQPVAWSASNGKGQNYRLTKSGSWTYVDGKDLAPEQWIVDPGNLEGSGSLGWDIHNISLAPHYTMTDWPGDTEMQNNIPYQRNGKAYTKGSPWDLSTCGRADSYRNTSNCYVIDRGGWYCFPLVYGNALVNNVDNKAAYMRESFSNQNNAAYGSYLYTMRDHLDNPITSPYINDDYCKGAAEVWDDVYNAIDSIEIFDGKDSRKWIRFHANSDNMQQGNVVIALYDQENDKNDPEKNSGNVVWSWHIWINEHWLDPETGQPNVYNSTAKAFTTYEESWSEDARPTRWRKRGDVKVNGVGTGRSNFEYMVSPYNLGWCDPKSLDYLRRPSTLEIVQKRPENAAATTGKQVSIPILQEGARVDYKYGNNTYYQFGRKDPFVGFVNHDDQVKRMNGPKQYEQGAQYNGVTIGVAIRNPNVCYCDGHSGTPVTDNDWNGATYLNLWNNTDKVGGYFLSSWSGNLSTSNSQCNNEYFFHSTKTIYDPCPPGYMVPPAALYKIVGTNNNGYYIKDDSNNKLPLTKFNGVILDEYTYKIYANGTGDQNCLWLTSTGHRWYTNYRTAVAPHGGFNYNSQMVYLWSSCSTGRSGASGLSAYGLALGYDKLSDTTIGYCITGFFNGRRSMARPVRPIRENYTY